MSEKRRIDDDNTAPTTSSSSSFETASGVTTVNDSTAIQLYKKARTESEALILSSLSSSSSEQQQIVTHSSKLPSRTSHLAAPTMSLSGHQAAVYTVKFNRQGTQLASAGADKLILLWQVYGDCANYGVLKGHTGAILEVVWSITDDQLFSCSVDHTAAIWDTETQQRIKKLKHHHNVVNGISSSMSQPALFTTVGDDGLLFLYDSRTPKSAIYQYHHPYPLLTVAMADTQYQLYISGIDPTITCIDYRYHQQQYQKYRQFSINNYSNNNNNSDHSNNMYSGILYTMAAHTETVTGLSVNESQTMLLSHGQDCIIYSWDIQPYVSASNNNNIMLDPRLVQQYRGSVHDMEQNLLRVAWSPDGSLVTSGSADRHVYIWDTQSGRLRYRLPGHRGSVNEVRLHPREPIIVSGASDKLIYLGEL